MNNYLIESEIAAPLPCNLVEADSILRLAELTQKGVGGADWDIQARQEKFSRLRRTIGNTPIEEVYPSPDLKVLAKQEFKNPSGSHYDRAYIATIDWLEANGYIKPGDELRDITSGSAGISLSLIGSILDYKVRITVPPELPPNRIAPIKIFGAEVSVSASGYVPSASMQQSSEIKDMLRNGWKRQKIHDPDVRAVILRNQSETICYLNHSENKLSPVAFEDIGTEFVATCEQPEAIVLAIGNWTTIAGIASVIRREWFGTRIVGYQDSRTTHDSFGLNVPNVPLRFNDPALIDEIVEISPDLRDGMDERFNTKRSELMQVGRSSLMGLCAAELIADSHAVQSVGAIFYDQKTRY